MYNNIPVELAKTRQWTYSKSTAELKRPTYTKYQTDGSLSLTEAWEQAGEDKLIGFYTTKQDHFVIGDIDHVENPKDLSTLPIEVADLLSNYGAYCEISPSGRGIRFFLVLEDGKEKLYKDIYYHKTLGREIQLNVGPPWLTVTGNILPYSAYTVGKISMKDLEGVFNFREKEECVVAPPTDNPPSFQELVRALHGIPMDQNPRIRRAFENIFKESYSHYVFWLKVIMAMHHYASFTNTKPDCLEQVIKWSESDPESFDGEQPVIDKWNSLSKSTQVVSYKTLFGLYYSNLLRWSKTKPLTKKQKELGMAADPLNTEFVNFLDLLNHYDIVIYKDIHSPVKFYITADEDIAERYFTAIGIQKYLDKYYGVFSKDTLVAAFHILCQDVGFLGISHIQVRQFISNALYQVQKELNIIREYFDTPFKELPEKYRENERFYSISTVDYMFSCLSIDYQTTNKDKERDLYETYYRSWLMGFARNLFYRDSYHMNNCVLLLTGKEQIRKTSHFKFMLPKFMRSEYLAFTTHGFDKETSMRDVVKLSSENMLIVWDEIEQYLSRNSESNFKKIIDNNPQKFIDKYEVVASNIIPMAVYGATSNKREFNLSDTGSRRLYHIPVSWVDTDKLDKVCWHRIVNELREEIKSAPCDNPPWLLTKSQLGYQALLHNRITNKTGMEFVLSEMFEWDSPSCIRLGRLPVNETNPKSSKHCLTFRKLKSMVAAEIGHVPPQKEQIALKHSIIKLSGEWTGTTHDRKSLSKPFGEVFRGQLKLYGTNFYLVPKRKTS